MRDVRGKEAGRESPVRAWVARPLAPDERAEAERVAARMGSEFSRLVAGLPEHARHASGMARHLGVLRVTCQRAVSAIGDPSVQMLAKLPGVEGLRQLLEGFRRVGADATALGAAESAIESFERLIASTGGSQTRLAERINTNLPASGADEGTLATPAQRRELFLSAARVTGRRCETSLSIYAFRPLPDDPLVLERALAKGLIGSYVHAGGLPMVLSSGDTLRTEDEVSNVTSIESPAVLKGRTPEAILRPFTTSPLPMVTSNDRGGTLFQIIDSKSVDPGAPIDVVTALRASAPMYDPKGKPTLDSVWSLVSCPSERLILDVYLHASMERDFRPSLDALLWSASLDIAPENKWALRLPAQPKLQLLGRGTANAASELYPRHAELSRYFFEHIGWDAGDFIGFRCEVVYPIWRAGYCMAFEYLRGDGPAPTA